jgi:hypothetical protein
MVNPALFAGADRYHEGGIPGLKPGEVPLIALKTEEIITGDDSRHVRNGGKAPTTVKMKNVNVFDPADVVEQALATEAGERVMFNFMTRNASRLAKSIGVK